MYHIYITIKILQTKAATLKNQCKISPMSSIDLAYIYIIETLLFNQTTKWG